MKPIIILPILFLASCGVSVEGEACAILPDGNKACVTSEKATFKSQQ